MSKPAKKGSSQFKKVANHGDFSLYTHKQNNLTLLHYPKPKTGVITSNITYSVGSVDEKRGESGLAHMLEHMLFKPTANDLKQKIYSGAGMQFERETGATLNANTNYDRTTYYFSYPKHWVSKVLKIEADRMQNVVLSDEQFQPERGNVLSEFDMYNSDPYFALEVAMRTATFTSHAYDHEVIGFREDIEDYSTEKLQRFYDMYYQPSNATLMLIGDITAQDALELAEQSFGRIENRVDTIERESAREPAITGPKTVTVTRPGTTNLVGFGFVHAAFPNHDWYAASLAIDVLAGGPESPLHIALVDSGLVSSLDAAVFSSAAPNMGMLFARLAAGVNVKQVEEIVFSTIASLTQKQVAPLLKKQKTKLVTDKLFTRSSTLGIAAELTEFAAARALPAYTTSTTDIQNVTPKDVLRSISTLFDINTLTTGYYKSV